MPSLIIRNGYLLTMDPAQGDAAMSDVRIEGDRIVEIGRDLTATGAMEIDATGKIVFPGLIDGHNHLWLSLLRSTGGDWSFPRYMVEARAIYAGCFDADAAYLANYAGGVASLNAGITSIVDHCHLQSTPEVSDALARGLKDSGIAGAFCYALQNAPNFTGPEGCDPEAVTALLTRLPDEWHDENASRIRDTYFQSGPLRFGIALPEMTPYVPADFAAAIIARAMALRPALLTGHWGAISKDDFYQCTLKELVEKKAFQSACILSHNNNLRDDDFQTMASSGLGLCTCPEIEYGMGIGHLAACRFAALGGNASLGTDVPSAVQSDMFKQARTLLAAERMRDAEKGGHAPKQLGVKVRDALAFLTLSGAKSIGMGDEIGSLTVGKRADIVVVEPTPFARGPLADPAETLLFQTDAADVETVLVAGEFRKRDGKLVGVDLGELGRKVGDMTAQIKTRFDALPKDELQNAWGGMF